MTTYQQLKAKIEYISKKAPRRDEVLRRIMAGESDPDIADNTGLHKGTVRKHISNLYNDFNLARNYTGESNPRRQLLDLFARYASNLTQDGKTEYVPQDKLPPPEPPPYPLRGCLSLDSPYYVRRSADEKLHLLFSQHQDKSSIFVRVKGSKGMGKSSLLVRLRQYLEQELNHFVAIVNLSGSEFDQRGLEDFNTLLYRFTYLITRAFRPILDKEPPPLKSKWDDALIPGTNCTDYLEEYVFSQIPQAKTLIIDGIDAVLEHESSYAKFSEFLRSWYENKMKQVSAAPIVWPHIVMAYSTEPYANYQNPIGSPLQNVGIVLELPEFSPEQVRFQANQYGLKWDEVTVSQAMEWVGGHPELINRTLYRVASNRKKNDKIDTLFVDVIAEKNRSFDDYLLKNLQLLRNSNNSALAQDFLKTLRHEEWRDEFGRFQLEKAGLIKIEGDELRVRFKLYQEYFKKHLEVDRDD
ncbi:MAG: AAA-like domain-containing protein [Cyanobacteriota bacterium]|nr:AAA-like domain-containing protein [Cyanobacteriota bacterium]